MTVTVLNNHKPMGKRHSIMHPTKGSFNSATFTCHQDFTNIIRALKENQCFTVGLYPDTLKYTVTKDPNIHKDGYLTREANNATPGHILCIDNDLESFGNFDLHTFLTKHIPDIFSGMGYIKTMSSSHYLKGKDTWHQYYLFEHPHNFTPLIGLIDRVLKEHQIIGYKFSSNYARTFVRTPIDKKLNELQQPIFEFTTTALNELADHDENRINEHLGKPQSTDNISELTIVTQPGEIYTPKTLSIPSIDTPNSHINVSSLEQAVEPERLDLFNEFYKDTPPLERRELQNQFTRHKLTGDFTLHLYHSNAKHTMTAETIQSLYIDHYHNDTPLHELYYQPGEPDYADRQMSKLYPDSHILIAQGHGGQKYQIIHNYAMLLAKLGTLDKLETPTQLRLLNVQHNLDMPEMQALSAQFQSKVFTKSNITKHLQQYQTDENPIDTTIINATEGSEVSFEIDILDKVLQKHNATARSKISGTATDLINTDEVLELRISVAGMDKSVLLKPNSKHNLIIAPQAQIRTNITNYYTPTVSPALEEEYIRQLLAKFTEDSQINSSIYRASLHSSDIYVGEGRLERTFKIAGPREMSDLNRQLLGSMSYSHRQEFEEIYTSQSIGQIVNIVADMAYAKIVKPDIKNDFIWAHFPSDAGKTKFANQMTEMMGVTKESLNQLNEQASKLSPEAVASSTLWFHDEFKHFNHNWKQLGENHKINAMWSTAGVLTQLPLKLLASAEASLKDGISEQEMNRILSLTPDKGFSIKPITSIPGLDISKYGAEFGAVSTAVIHREFLRHYNKYAGEPLIKATSLANRTSSIYKDAYSLGLKITDKHIKDRIYAYFIELAQMYTSVDANGEFHTIQEGTELRIPNPLLAGLTKKCFHDNNNIYITFRSSVSVAAVSEAISREISDTMESQTLKFEAKGLKWEDIGAIKQTKQKTLQSHAISGTFLTIPKSYEEEE